MKKRKLQIHEGKRGYWMTSRGGKPFFVEEEAYKKWLLQGGLGLLATAVGVIAGRKVNIVARVAKSFNASTWGKAIQDAWRGRHVLGSLAKSNSAPGQAGFKHRIKEFTALRGKKYQVKTVMTQDGASVGSMTYVLDSKKKSLTIKALELKDFKAYNDGLGKALRSPYDYAVENGYQDIFMKVHKGEQSIIFPHSMGTTWADKATELKMKREAKAAFDAYHRKLSKTEGQAWNTGRVKAHIEAADHPSTIITGHGWPLGEAMSTKYFQDVGPLVMRRVSGWKGKISLTEKASESYTRFNTFVGYGAAPQKSLIRRWGERFTSRDFWEISPTKTSPIYNMQRRQPAASGTARFEISSGKWKADVTTTDNIITKTSPNAKWMQGKTVEEVLQRLERGITTKRATSTTAKATRVNKRVIEIDERGYEVLPEKKLLKKYENLESVMKRELDEATINGRLEKGWWVRNSKGKPYFLTEEKARRELKNLEITLWEKRLTYEEQVAGSKRRKARQKKATEERNKQKAEEVRKIYDEELRKKGEEKRSLVLLKEERDAALEDIAIENLMISGKDTSYLSIMDEVARISKTLDEQAIAEWVKTRPVLRVSAKGAYPLKTKTGFEANVTWTANSDRLPTYTFTIDELAGGKKSPEFKLEQFTRAGKDPDVGGRASKYNIVIQRFSPANRAAVELTGTQNNPFLTNREFIVFDDAVNYLNNWIKTSGHFPNLEPIIVPGKKRMTVISPLKKYRFAIDEQEATALGGGRTGKALAAGKWRIYALGKAKDSHDISRVFSSREDAEKFLEQYLAKAEV